MAPKCLKNRTSLACKFCLKIQERLPMHLRRSCRKLAEPEEISRLVSEARENMLNILRGLSVVNYRDLDYKNSNPRDFFVQFLEKNGCYVRGKPVQLTRYFNLSPEIQQLENPEEQTSQEFDTSSEDNVTAELDLMSDQVDDVDRYFNSSTEVQQLENPEEQTLQDVETSDTSSEDNATSEPDLMSDQVDDIGSSDMSTEEDIEDPDVEVMESHVPDKVLGIEYKEMTSIQKLHRRMKKAGMYRKHSLSSKILVGFQRYLKDTLSVPNCTHEVANVARFLYFMDPSKPSLNFVSSIERTNYFFDKLKAFGHTHSTLFNYLKHIRRFVRYHLTATKLIDNNEHLYEQCESFLELTDDIQKRLRKGITKETKARNDRLMSSDIKTPEGCQRILSVAKPCFLEVLEKVKAGVHVGVKEKSTMLYYLESLVVLKHLQRPGVFKNILVEDWCNRLHYTQQVNSQSVRSAIINIKDQKTSSQQSETLILNEEEEQWFEIYYTKVRPTLIKNLTDTKIFFISTTGEQIYNVSNDLDRFHRRFGLTPVNSQEARRISETHLPTDFFFRKVFGRSKVALGGKFYPDRIVGATVAAADILSFVTSDPQPSVSSRSEQGSAIMPEVKKTGNPGEKEQREASMVPGESREDAYKKFTELYPLNLDSDPPGLKKGVACSPVHGRYCNDRWRKTQNRMRIDHISGHFKTRKPKENEVKKIIQFQRWNQNLPTIKDIMDNCKAQLN